MRCRLRTSGSGKCPHYPLVQDAGPQRAQSDRPLCQLPHPVPRREVAGVDASQVQTAALRARTRPDAIHVARAEAATRFRPVLRSGFTDGKSKVALRLHDSSLRRSRLFGCPGCFRHPRQHLPGSSGTTPIRSRGACSRLPGPRSPAVCVPGGSWRRRRGTPHRSSQAGVARRLDRHQ